MIKDLRFKVQDSSKILQILLKKRGIKNKKQAEEFLNPDYKRDLHDPFLMRDMEKSCKRVFDAISKQEKIVIYADYDCDGIPGAVILTDLFKIIKYDNVEVYIPQRNSEGYGLNLGAIREFAGRDVKLIITIDLGITAVEEVKQAKEMSIDVIVTDHHIPQENKLPKACAILNPKIDDYPEKMLCGAGVIFKFAQGFLEKYREYFKIKEGIEKWMLDMAGFATLSDIVPLVGENRALAYFGIKVFRKSKRIGLKKLFLQSRIDQKNITEDDLSFAIAPRINAASRMDDPMIAYKLLSTENENEAQDLAMYLTKINNDRKLAVANIVKDVKIKLISREIRDVIVIGNPKWQVGILGLVAGKISEEYQRPTFVWGKDKNECIKGSCRSVKSISVVELMAESNESFLEFGGHELSGGFTVHQDKIHSLEEDLVFAYSRKINKNAIANLNCSLDQEWDISSDLSIVNKKVWSEIQKLAPFGCANPKPIFLFQDLMIKKINKFGKNHVKEHLEIIFSDQDGNTAKGIAFFSKQDSFKIEITEDNIKNKKFNLLANLDINHFNDNTNIRLKIIDIF